MSGTAITKTIQLLTFNLENEVFGIEISQIKEVLEYTELTKVPKTPEFMCGVINLRGNVVPVMDLRLKFGMPSSKLTVNTCIIIIEVNNREATTVLGAIVDSVKEVMNLEPNQIEPAPKVGTMKTDFIHGMGKQNDQFIIILDDNKLIS